MPPLSPNRAAPSFAAAAPRPITVSQNERRRVPSSASRALLPVLANARRTAIARQSSLKRASDRPPRDNHPAPTEPRRGDFPEKQLSVDRRDTPRASPPDGLKELRVAAIFPATVEATPKQGR